MKDVIEYRSRFICKTNYGYVVKDAVDSSYNLHHGMFDNVEQAKAHINTRASIISDLPALGSFWTHKNGNKYKVIALANTRTERPEQYPVTVVYENINNGTVWCRKATDWHRSMTKC